MMIGITENLARPYAKAAFEFALEKHALPSWQAFLMNASQIVMQKEMRTLLSNPEVSPKVIIDIFFTLLDPVLDEKKGNFLKLLSDYKRLPILPSISMLFDQLRENHEKMITVDFVSAIPVTPEYQHMLEKHLAKRLQRKISLKTDVDPSLIGGAIVRAGDTVFDGSVRGKLNRLLESL